MTRNINRLPFSVARPGRWKKKKQLSFAGLGTGQAWTRADLSYPKFILYDLPDLNVTTCKLSRDLEYLYKMRTATFMVKSMLVRAI